MNAAKGIFTFCRPIRLLLDFTLNYSHYQRIDAAGVKKYGILKSIPTVKVTLIPMSHNELSITQEIDEIKNKVADALALAQQYGATSAEISISRTRGLSVCSRNEEVETVEFNQDGALGIAVYRGQQKGSASTSDLSLDALKRTVKAACDIARHTSEDECAGLADKALLEFNPPDLDLYHPKDIAPEQAIELTRQAEAAAFAVSDKIVNSDGASFSGHEGFRVYGNTHGQIVGYPSSRYSLSCGVIAKDKDQMQRDFEYTISRIYEDMDAVADVGRKSAESALSKLHFHKIGTTRAPVIFRADAAASLFGHLVSAIGGASLYRQSSFLLDRVDTAIMPEHVNIVERPHILRGLASSSFDSEGVKTIDRTIVENGVLKTYLLATYAARKLGMQSTGHAGGIHNWQMQPTMGDLDAMVKQMDRGFLITDLMGQGVNIVNGDYSRGASGFWVENGQIQYPISEVTIAGNLADIYQNIVGCGSDIDKRGGVHTGSILIDNMQIAGS